MSILIYVLVLMMCVLPPPTRVFAATETDISRLRSDLLKGYDKYSRPTHQGNATVVSVAVYLNGFDLDDENSLFTGQFLMMLKWHDEHLTWNPDSYGGQLVVMFDSSELWKPDVMAYNNVDKSEFDPYGKVPMFVEQENASSTSTVYWVPFAKFQVDCRVNLRAWPFDEQECEIILGSWTHDGEDIDLRSNYKWGLLDSSFFSPNREWHVTEKWVESRVSQHLPDGMNPELLLTFRLKRRYSAHAACIVMPGLVIIAATLVSFWLPPGSRERTSILLLSIFINIFFLHNVHTMIPSNGDSTPLVVLFFRDSLLMLGFSLIFTVCLRHLANTKRAGPALPRIVTNFVEGLPGKILCLEQQPAGVCKKQKSTTEETENSTEDVLEGSDEKKINSFVQEDWAWLAHLIDRVVFLLYLIIYACLYLALL